jgi:putative ABC transport system substrate-binding protein
MSRLLPYRDIGGGLVRKLLFPALWLSLLLSCQGGEERHLTVGILNHATVAEDSIRGFKDVMEESGYREGERIDYLYRGAVPKEELVEEANRLTDAGVDLILSVTMPATMAALTAGADERAPVVFAPNSNPVAAGVVASMDSPGGNITGVSFWIQEDKRLEWLKRIVPTARRVTVPYMDWDRSPRIEVEKLEAVAARIGLEIVRRPIDHPGKIAEVAAAISSDSDAIFIPADALIESNAPLFIESALRHGVPVTSPQSYGFSQGALFAYGFVQYETGRQGARLALQIFQGEAAGGIPVEMAETRLMINLKSAAALGIDIPPEIISTADMIIR